VLEDAVEADLIEKNPAKGRKRRAKSSKVNRSYLTSDQVQVLLDAAEQLDEDHRQRPQFDAGHRKAMVATLTFAGLRIGELSALKWRDVDLASGKLHVRQSKTDAGVRVVDLAGHVQESLAELKTRTEYAEPEHYVFSTKKGNRTRHSTIRGRVWTETDKDGEVVTKRRGVFHPSVELANRLIEENELQVERLPEDLTPHGLRRTFAGLLFEVGANVPYVMAQMGHEDPRVTLGIYARVVRDQTEVRDRLDQLVRSEKATEKATEPPEPGDKDLVVEAEGR
jgi:integrase